MKFRLEDLPLNRKFTADNGSEFVVCPLCNRHAVIPVNDGWTVVNHHGTLVCNGCYLDYILPKSSAQSVYLELEPSNPFVYDIDRQLEIAGLF
jgi:hypothetical protein